MELAIVFRVVDPVKDVTLPDGMKRSMSWQAAANGRGPVKAGA